VSPLLKFWSLTRREQHLFCEASVLLLLSTLCVKVLTFKRIYSFLCKRYGYLGARAGEASNCARNIELVNLSISRAARRLPWKGLCLSQSIAAFIMLRRRGIPATLLAGVRVLEDSSLSAHAWVKTGDEASETNLGNSDFTVVVRIGKEPVSSI
jgi:hypothetical protein